MPSPESAATAAIAIAKRRGLHEVTPDDLLLGCLQSVSQFGIAQLGSLTIDLEDLDVDWRQAPEKGAGKVAYSSAVVTFFDEAARLASADGSGDIRMEHLLAAFTRETSGLMGDLKRRYNITSQSWRAALAQFSSLQTPRDVPESKNGNASPSISRDYLSPEAAAEALGIHVQTVRAYVRSGKLPAFRLAGERAIRIRKDDLEAVLEPFIVNTEAVS